LERIFDSWRAGNREQDEETEGGLKVPDTFGEPFKDQIEALLSRRVRPAKAGRPKVKVESKAEIPV
jgi:hypothetical protein